MLFFVCTFIAFVKVRSVMLEEGLSYKLYESLTNEGKLKKTIYLFA